MGADGTLFADVTSLARRWELSPERHFRLDLKFRLGEEASPNSLPIPALGAGELTLEVETETEGKAGSRGCRERRERREAEASGEDCQRRQRTCCRKSLQVSFKEIGWTDWIRAPESYNMYNCGGSCPDKYKAANMHAMIKSSLHRLSGGSSPGLCCTPASYEPMTLLHYSSEGRLTLTAFEGMIVTQCHCS
ncbi:growth/differentiation factor 15-like [Callorhinchus milii]|uniref:growth/differentiation factor 15-like n=1 Tax=Callorhinchus milii TaxID=7868 RepID=UPI001C3F754D|nr:growth/differentiation factor 15-like [Callorhinchus milii]